MKILRTLILFGLILIPFVSIQSKELNYPNFDQSPLINPAMQEMMRPYLIPLNHPAKLVLDAIFSSTRVTENLDSVKAAGFDVMHVKESSFVIVARHKALPGYVFKMYLDSDPRTRYGRESWHWLTDRCIGVERISKMIKKKKIKYFVTPKKYLYPLPLLPTQGPKQHPVILIATDMHVVSTKRSEEAWQTVPNKKLLKELHYILSNGSGSWFLSSNVPYTKEGKFTFIDTEYPKRKITMKKVKDYIAPEFHQYWDSLSK